MFIFFSFCSKSLIWVPVSFLSLLVPCTFLFHFSYPSLFPLFCNHTQPILWASWLPVVWTLHLIGCLSLSCLVLFLEFWSVLPLGPFFIVSAHLLHCKGQSLRYWPRRGNPGHFVVVPYVGEGWEREQCCLLSSHPTFSHFPHYPQANCTFLVLILRCVGFCMF